MGNDNERRLEIILRELDRTRLALDEIEHQVVSMLRDRGETWESIGEEIGISRQAARQRFAKLRRRR